MNLYRSMAMQCSLALFLATGVVLGVAWQRGQFLYPPVHPPTPPPTFYYGANGATMDASVLHIWPQKVGPYCAIATAMGVVNYVDQEDHLALLFTGPSYQVTIASANQKLGASRWGYALPINSTAGITNIAPDHGVDPRAAAYIQYHYAPQGTIFHNYIYRWQFHGTTEPSFQAQTLQATMSLFRAWLTYPEPMSVIVNGGEHSVIISGGWTGNDIRNVAIPPLLGVIVRDPEFAGSISRFEVTSDEWTNNGTDFGAGYYSLWSRYYGVNPNFTVNTDDPEPSVGIYRPTAQDPVHWYQGFSWVQRDNQTANGLFSPDWAFTDTGTLLTAP